MSKIQDKTAILHVLGSLMNDATLLAKTRGYNLDHDDFPEKMHKLVFSSIYNLYHQGVEKVTPADIYSYLKEYPTQLKTFEDNNGLEYTQRCSEIGTVDNFEFYFSRVRKFSYLRECAVLGIDTKDIYDFDVFDPKEKEEMEIRFEAMSINDMMRYVDLKVVSLKEKYLTTSESVSEHMSEGAIDNLRENLSAPSYGANFQSKFSNTITRGCKPKKFYLRSAPTGGGKTRYNLADLLEITIPRKYYSEHKAWLDTNNDGAGLFITTEIPKEDIQLACICHIAEVDEDKVKDNDLTAEETQRLYDAVKILENSNLRIEQLEDFDLEQIELTIEKNILKYDVRYVVFDYIHTSLRLLTQIGNQAKGLREDLILLILSDKLKGIANKYEISMISSTQMNDNWKEDGTANLDQSSIRGSKAIADKIDTGMILLPINAKDRKFFTEEIIPVLLKTDEYRGFQTESVPMPTHTLNYYKNRESKWNNVRLWLNIDMGTLRTKDICVSRYDGTMVEKMLKTTINEELVSKVEGNHEKKMHEKLKEADNTEINKLLNPFG